MSLLCIFGFHDWDDACCVRCDKRRETLAELACTIESLHAIAGDTSRRNSFGDHRCLVDRGKTLLEVWKRVPPDQREAWVKSNLSFSYQEAKDYIRIYEATL